MTHLNSEASEEMKQKYLRFHPNTSTRSTLRPPRLLENMNQKELEKQEKIKQLLLVRF